MSVFQHGNSPEEEAGRLRETQEALDEAQPAVVPPTNRSQRSSSRSTTPAKDIEKKPKEVIAWRDLPRKQQLLVIALTRLSEPLVQTSLQSYMFYQLKWFDPSLPDSVISSQAGILHASFTAAQFLTAMMWGRIADSSRFGRKTVVLIGLTGTMISCLGFGLSTSFWQALMFRSLGGITNGNVGVLRTMILEIVREKKYQQRAFVLLPMTFNIGIIIGPILGGILADPAKSYPNVLGNVEFFLRYPYALPNLVSAFFLFSAGLSAWLCLEEVSACNAKTFTSLSFQNSRLTNNTRLKDTGCSGRQGGLGQGAWPKDGSSFERLLLATTRPPCIRAGGDNCRRQCQF